MSRLRGYARECWETGALARDEVTAAAAASADLAARAYARGEVEARWRAESIMYFLTIDSSFAPPLHPSAGVVWMTLMHAKLSYLRDELGVGPAGAELGTGELQEKLEGAVARWGAFNHPLLEDLERAQGLDGYRVWAKNWFGSCYGFSSQLASLVQRTVGATRKAVLGNLSDEFGDNVTHDALRVRFYESLGLRHSPETAVADPDWVLESTELLNLRTGLCNLSDPMPALGCFYGIEANWPRECRRHHAMHKRRGFDDDVVQYWTAHAFTDEHHAQEWLEAVKSLCQTDAQRAAVLEGAVIQLRLRWRMYDAIRSRIAAIAR